jgi:hypothetical protein
MDGKELLSLTLQFSQFRPPNHLHTLKFHFLAASPVAEKMEEEVQLTD